MKPRSIGELPPMPEPIGLEANDLLAKATKRPWSRDDRALMRVRSGDRTVCSCGGSQNGDERETDHSNAALIVIAVNQYEGLIAEVKALRADQERNAAAIALMEADTKRMDWLESDIKDISWRVKSWILHGKKPEIVCAPVGDKWPGKRVTTSTLRECIDAAMKESGK